MVGPIGQQERAISALLGYFLWGAVKYKCYVDHTETTDRLKTIFHAGNEIIFNL